VSFVRPASVCEHSAFKTQVGRIVLRHKVVVHEHSAMNDHGFDLCLDWQAVVKHCHTVILKHGGIFFWAAKVKLESDLLLARQRVAKGHQRRTLACLVAWKGTRTARFDAGSFLLGSWIISFTSFGGTTILVAQGKCSYRSLAFG